MIEEKERKVLISLHVKNLALIEETELFFGPGLNILTGETGAGKSVVLGSVALALGAKADRDMIRTGAPYALIELVFESTEAVNGALERLGISTDANMVILQRRIMAGKSLCRVNSETVNAKVLQELAGMLIDIHGQRDSQALLQTRRHLEILDDYAGAALSEKKDRLRKAWQRYHAILRQIDENKMDTAMRKRELSLAQYEIREIQEAMLTEGEDEQLEKDYWRMSNGRRIAESLDAVHVLTGYETADGAGESIGRALRELSGVLPYDENLEEFYSQLSEVDGLLNDFNRSVSEYLTAMEFDDQTFQMTQERLNYLNRLKEKYGKTVSEILAYAEKRKEQAERLENQDAWLLEKNRELQSAREEMDSLAGELSVMRKKAADAFTKDMETALSDLNFLKVDFQVSLTKKESCSADGQDDAVFYISTNPGEPVKPLSSVASGGELSRIMLALKTVTARQEAVGTFIFDEIDAGISGKTAWKVSEKLGILGRTHQIICITHLPQIAAMADTHFYIKKEAVKDTTVTTIRQLDPDESLQELARLSGAVELNENVMANVREMKELAEKNK